MLENGGDPFQKNKKGESVESILNDMEDPEDLKSLIDIAKQNLSVKTTGRASVIHNAIEDGNILKLQIYSMLGANFYSFNEKGERPIETAITNLENANVEIVLYVLNCSQSLLDEEKIFKLVFQFLEKETQQKNINETIIKKYEDSLLSLIEKATKRGKNIQNLLKTIQSPSLLFLSDLLKLAIQEGTNENNISFLQSIQP